VWMCGLWTPRPAESLPSAPSRELAAVEPATSSTLSDLPVELMQLIATSHLQPDAAAALLCTCSAYRDLATAVWSAKTALLLTTDARAKYGDPSSKPAAEWRQIFAREQAFSGKVSCATAHIMHGDNPSYWRAREMSTESIFGEVAHCRSVCWYDITISATLPRGSYEVFWCVSTNSRWGYEPFHFSVRLAGESARDADAAVCPEEAAMTAREIHIALVKSATSGWSLLPVGTVDVRAVAADVQARMWKHSGSWVGPIRLDYVQFARVQ